MVEAALDTLALAAIGVGLLTVLGGFIAWVLNFRFAAGKARLLAIGFTAAITLPLLIEGTLVIGLVGAVAVLLLIVVLKADYPDAG